jgi:hypothetical protein
MQKILLLDLDGTISPFDARPGLIDVDWSHANFCYEPAIVDRVNAMPYSKRYLTTWCEDAPEAWGHVLHIKEWLDTVNVSFGLWRIDALVEFAKALDSPARIVWADDEMGEVDRVTGKTWKQVAYEAMEGSGHELLCLKTADATGLTMQDLDAIDRFMADGIQVPDATSLGRDVA